MTPPPDLRALARTGPIHFVGIGGAGMYALAEWLVAAGGTVSGCDRKDGPALARLRALGVPVAVGHAPEHVADAVAVVYTPAIPADHPELAQARARGLPVLKRADALGAVVATGRVVAVAGTHGKTSTTALAVEVLAAAGLDPTGFVGGKVAGWGGHLRRGADAVFVVEADEYDRAFHTLAPDVAIVTNVEADHLDVYGDVEGVRAGFRTFLDGLRPGGTALICADDPGASALAASCPAARTYGLAPGTQLRATDLQRERGGVRFRVLEDGVDRGPAHLTRPGDHHLRNALAAAGAARALGASWDAIREGWAAFRGVARRFEHLGSAADVVVIDDYAHHPTEIAATLAALRQGWPERRLVAVFQPHLYTRTRDFADAFGAALARADRVWLTDVFPAREPPIEGVDGRLVVETTRRAGGDAAYEPSLERLPDAVAADLAAGDLVVTLGAGSIEGTGARILSRLQGRDHG